MQDWDKYIVDLFHKISAKRGGIRSCSQKLNHFDLFRSGFVILLCGYARRFFHKQTPYSAKKLELTQNILNQLKWVQCCTLATSDVILL